MDTEHSLPDQLLVVGDEADSATLMSMLGEVNWSYTHVRSPGEALARIRQGHRVDAILMFPRSQLRDHAELCRTLKLESRTAYCPVVVLIESTSPNDRVAVYRAGADDCIQLPTTREELILRVLKSTRAAHAMDSLEDATAVITALANAIEGKDSYTCGHVERVATYALEIGKALGLGPSELHTLRIGALLHDIGKVTVPDEILNKRGQLSDQEMDVVKRHPLVGFQILSSMRTFESVRPLVRWHHERPNGRGYPDGIGGDDLPLLPRIVAVADCFDALSSDRPYRPALSLDRCQEILQAGAECGDLDADVVHTLAGILARGVGTLQPVSDDAAILSC